jgi:hypothetical protein
MALDSWLENDSEVVAVAVPAVPAVDIDEETIRIPEQCFGCRKLEGVVIGRFKVPGCTAALPDGSTEWRRLPESLCKKPKQDRR